MINTKIRLIIFFAAKGGEALYSQQKQDYAPTSNADKAETEWFYEELQDLLELT